MANILVIDDDKNILRLLEYTLKKAGHDVKLYTNGVDGLAFAKANPPDLIIVDVMMPRITGHEFCRQARQVPTLEETPIVVFSARVQQIDRDAALDAGATDYLAKTTTPPEILQHVNQWLADAPAATLPTPMAIGVFSLRGGAGSSTIAVNLAIAFALMRKQETVLVDLAQPGGHTALMLGVRPDKHVTQALAAWQQQPTIETLQPYFTAHRSGVQLLPSAQAYGQPLALDNGTLAHLIETLKAAYAVTVLDIPRLLEPTFSSALAQLDKVVLVVSPDMPAMQSTVMALQGLLKHRLREDKITLVVNHNSPRPSLTQQAIQKVVKRPILANIPFEQDMLKAVNSGQPLLLGYANTRGAKAIAQLAKALN